MLRQRPGKNDGPVGHVSPLDSDEQEELLATLSLEANRQTSLFQRVFSVLLAVCAVALVRCSAHLLWPSDSEPLPHRAALENVPSVAFLVTYIGQLLGLYLARKIAQGNQWHILPGVMVSGTSLFSWLAVFKHFGVTNPLFYWLPLGPAVVCGVSVYLFTSEKGLEKQIKELDGLRYNHKEL